MSRIYVKYIKDSEDPDSWWYLEIICPLDKELDLIHYLRDQPEYGQLLQCPFEEDDFYGDMISAIKFDDWKTKAEWLKELRKAVKDI